MFREIVREFFSEFEVTGAATGRPVSRQELIARVRVFAEQRLPVGRDSDGIVSALDAELGERVRAKRIARVSPGLYRLPGVVEQDARDIRRQGGPLAFSRRPDIDEEILRRLIPRELPPASAQERSARELFSEGYAGLDARQFVATGLLALRDEEYRSLMALQDFAL